MISILESTCEQKKKGLIHATHRDGPHQQVWDELAEGLSLFARWRAHFSAEPAGMVVDVENGRRWFKNGL